MKPIVFLLLGLSVFSLMACDGNSSSGSNGVSLSNSAVIDETAQTFTVYSPTCTYTDGAVTFDEKGLVNLYNYSVDAGVLKLVDEDGGDTIEFTGTSSTIMGTWEMSEFGIDITIDISESSVNTSAEYADDFCAMDAAIDELADLYRITKVSCTEATMAYNTDTVFTLKINKMAPYESSISTIFNGKTCTRTTKVITPITASLCTVANYEAGYIDTNNGTIYSVSNAAEYATCVKNMVGNKTTETAVTKISKSIAKVLSSAKK